MRKCKKTIEAFVKIPGRLKQRYSNVSDGRVFLQKLKASSAKGFVHRFCNRFCLHCIRNISTLLPRAGKLFQGLGGRSFLTRKKVANLGVPF